MERYDYIIAIAEEKNITRAAKRLYISQPALTRYINNLEEEYGVRIFDRKKKPIELTPAGELFLREKMRLAAEEQNLRLRLKAYENNQITLTIGTGFIRGQADLPPVLKNFCSRHPDVNLDIQLVGERKLPDLMEKGKVDLGFGCIEKVNSSSLEWRRLKIEELRLLIPLSFGLLPDDISPESTFMYPYQLRPEQLNGLNLIAPGSELGSYISYQILMNQYSIVPGRIITINSAAVVRSLILDGFGYSFTSLRSVENLKNEQGDFICACFTLPGLPNQRISRLAYQKDHPYKNLLEELADLLESSITRTPNAEAVYW